MLLIACSLDKLHLIYLIVFKCYFVHFQQLNKNKTILSIDIIRKWDFNSQNKEQKQITYQDIWMNQDKEQIHKLLSLGMEMVCVQVGVAFLVFSTLPKFTGFYLLKKIVFKSSNTENQ